MKTTKKGKKVMTTRQERQSYILLKLAEKFTEYAKSNDGHSFVNLSVGETYYCFTFDSVVSGADMRLIKKTELNFFINAVDSFIKIYFPKFI